MFIFVLRLTVSDDHHSAVFPAIEPTGPSFAELVQIVKRTVAASTIQGKRDYALMLLFLTTAVRVSVIADLRFGAFRRQGRRVFMT